MTLLRLFAAAAVACFALTAQASFHLWQMSELYSNADGTVQFLELRALSGGQQFVSGHSLEARGATGGSHTFEFSSNLGGDSSNKTMLVATQGFAALGIVQPDFIVPNAFFFQGGGTIVFAESADTWQYGALPTDGRSLGRTGQLATNSPRNFAGQTGTVPASAPAAATFNVHGLWGKDDEAGWGVNLAQHGNIIFLTWFTYDDAGAGMWLIMSGATLTGNNTWTGDVFRTTGAPFDNYNASALHVDPVGSGTLTFSDANHGTFAYRVGSVQQTKAISRFVFGTVPTCDQSGAAATNFTDLWGLTNEGGWGVNLVQQGDLIFLTWFTYGSDGRAMWLVGSGLQRGAGNAFTGDLFRTTGSSFAAYDPARFVVAKAGDATVTFTGASTGTFRYTVGSTTQTKSIARNVHATPATTCR